MRSGSLLALPLARIAGSATTVSSSEVECGRSYSNSFLKLSHDLTCNCSNTLPAIRLLGNTTVDLGKHTIACHFPANDTANINRSVVRIEGAFSSLVNGNVEGWATDYCVNVQESNQVSVDSIHIVGCSHGVEVVQSNYTTVSRVNISYRHPIFYSERDPAAISIEGGIGNQVMQLTSTGSLSQGIRIVDGSKHSVNQASFKHMSAKLFRNSGRIFKAIVLEGGEQHMIQNVQLSQCFEHFNGVEIVGGSSHVVQNSQIEGFGYIGLNIKGGDGHIVRRNACKKQPHVCILAHENATNLSVIDNDAEDSFATSGYHYHDNRCDNDWSNNNSGTFRCGFVEQPEVSTVKYAGSNFRYLSSLQYGIAVSVLLLSAGLSTFGSITIIYLIARKKKQWTLFHRIVLGLSVGDTISSVAQFLQPLLLPSSTHLYLAIGTEATSKAVGALSFFHLAANVYLFELTIYFWLVVARGYTDTRCRQWLEPWVHLVPWSLTIMYSGWLFGFDWLHPSQVVGWSLIGCEATHGRFSMQCVETLPMRKYVLVNSPQIVITGTCAIGGLVFTMLMYCSVLKQEARSRTYNFTTTSSVLSPSVQFSNKRRSSFRGRKSSFGIEAKQTRAVANQAVLYCVAFFNSFAGIVSMMVLRMTNEYRSSDFLSLNEHSVKVFVNLLAVYLFFPIQGIINWAIYVRPLVVHWRGVDNDKSWFWAYRQVLSGKELQRGSRTRTPRRGSALGRLPEVPTNGD